MAYLSFILSVWLSLYLGVCWVPGFISYFLSLSAQKSQLYLLPSYWPFGFLLHQSQQYIFNSVQVWDSTTSQQCEKRDKPSPWTAMQHSDSSQPRQNVGRDPRAETLKGNGTFFTACSLAWGGHWRTQSTTDTSAHQSKPQEDTKRSNRKLKLVSNRDSLTDVGGSKAFGTVFFAGDSNHCCLIVQHQGATLLP